MVEDKSGFIVTASRILIVDQVLRELLQLPLIHLVKLGNLETFGRHVAVEDAGLDVHLIICFNHLPFDLSARISLPPYKFMSGRRCGYKKADTYARTESIIRPIPCGVVERLV
jgi:hypothetical protein